jgi:hypothetical protein
MSELHGEVESIQTSKETTFFLSLSSDGFQFHLCLSARCFPLSAFCEHDLQSLTIVARVERFCCRTVLIPEKGQGNFFYSLQIAILQIL